MRDKETITLKSGVDVKASLTGPGHQLPPVTLGVDGGRFHYEDYLSPDEAEALGMALVSFARDARRQEAAEEMARV